MARSPKSDRAFRHNGLLGSNAMMIRHLMNVAESDTTTDAAKTTATVILSYADMLDTELRTRKD